MKILFTVPKSVQEASILLCNAGYEAYLVGGCVRDIIKEEIPKDWDITTNATPEQMLELFPHAHYDNTYGTVRYVSDDESLPEEHRVIEITTYRTESTYSDNRRPDEVKFSKQLKDDLKRRDFTINALALPLSSEKDYIATKDSVVDLWGGLDDLEHGVIRTVGASEERFSEDALRIMRAVRFATRFSYTIEAETFMSMMNFKDRLSTIASERVQEEFSKIIMTKNPLIGLEIMRRVGILDETIPELLLGVDMPQNKAHSYTVWEHLLKTLQGAADKEFPLYLRLAALFHDVAKPHTRDWNDSKKDWSFYGHEVVGAKITRKILERLKYPRETIEVVTKLVRWHMFFSDTETLTLSAVRRMVANVGETLIWDLINLRICDRIGTGRPKEEPYRLRKYIAMIEEVLRDPLSLKKLAVNGDILMKQLDIKQGRTLGLILNALMDDVLEHPEHNTEMFLVKHAQDLLKLPQSELVSRATAGKRKIAEEEQKALEQIHKKYRV